MKEHFVNYNQALALKELGFNEKCFAAYRDSEWIGHDGPNSRYFHAQLFSNSMFDDDQQEYCSAPLKSQVFKWFRDEHNIVHTVYSNASGYIWELHYNKERGGTHICDSEESGDCELSGMFTTYEGAESACIDNLIQIIK
jgi:hypothetical protein